MIFKAQVWSLLAAIRQAMVEDAAHMNDDDYADDLEDQAKVTIEEETENLESDALSVLGSEEDDDTDIAIEGGVSDLEEIEERFADDPSKDDLDYSEDFPADDFDDEDFDDDIVTRRRRRQREEAEFRASSRKAQMVAVGWVFLFLFFSTIVGLFFMIPERIVAWWPAANGIYEIVGVSHEPEPKHVDVVEVPNVRITPYASSMVADGNNYKLTLSGKIVNEGKRSITIPSITFKLSDAEDVEISRGSFCLPNRILRKSQSVEFEHIINPASISTAKADFEIKWEKDETGKTIDSCTTPVSDE